MIVTETHEAALVSSRQRSQDVRQAIEPFTTLKHEEHALHRNVHHPSDCYYRFDKGDHFKVKRIEVKPGASLSLQKNSHRASHWIIVTGTAEVTNDTKLLILTEKQPTYIPHGQVHRLANPGTTSLEIIEV